MKNKILPISCSEFLESVSAPSGIYPDLLNFFTKNEYVFLREGLVIKAYKQISVADSCRDSVAERAIDYRRMQQSVLACEDGSIDEFKKNLDSLIDGYDSVLVQRMLFDNPLSNFMEGIQDASTNQVNACEGWLDLFFKRFVSFRVNRDEIYAAISFDVDVAFKDLSKDRDYLTYAKSHEAQVNMTLHDYIEIKSSIVSKDQKYWSESVVLNALGLQLNDLCDLSKLDVNKDFIQSFLSEINGVLAIGTSYGYMPFLKAQSKITLLELFSLVEGSGVISLPLGSKFYMDFPSGLYFERDSLDGAISAMEIPINQNQVKYIHLY